MNIDFFMPSLAATDYHFCIKENGEDREVTIKRIGTFFYRKEEDVDSLAPLGNFKDLINWLYERQAVWQSAKKGKRNPKLFYGTAAAMHHLVTGGSVFSLEMKTIISYDDAYQGLYTSEHQRLAMLPAGVYAVAFLEPKKSQTQKEVQEKEKMKCDSEEISMKEQLQDMRNHHRQMYKELYQTKSKLNHATKKADEYRTELDETKQSQEETCVKYCALSALLGAALMGGATVLYNKFIKQ